MLGKISYNIADHIVEIVTKREEQTRALLPNFEPFLVKGLEGEEQGSEPLVRLYGEVAISTEGVEKNDEFDWNGIHYTVYSDQKRHYVIEMQLQGETHRMRYTRGEANVETDLTLTATRERLFINNFTIVAYGLSATPHNTLKLHASAIVKNGQALLFLGTSGTGKSTHSRLWLEHIEGCFLLNDDEPIVRVKEDGSVWAYGTPWSGSTPCYKRESARLVGLVHLYQAPENRLRELSAVEAFSSLFVSSSMLRSDEQHKQEIFEVVMALLEKVPVYRLDCRPDREAAELTHSLIRSAL